MVRRVDRAAVPTLILGEHSIRRRRKRERSGGSDGRYRTKLFDDSYARIERIALRR